jgi:3-phenylpropionate/trans-cinnamate dioxygenase ferredoxin subunit
VFVDVVGFDELVDRRPRLVTVEGRELGLIRWGEDVYALRNICPHQFGPVCRGHVMPLITGELDGSLAADADRPVVVCPWHGWEFDIATGRSAWGDTPYRYKLKTYPVRIEDGRVLVRVDARAAAREEAANAA